ncbi:S-formylglutathione hydrolase FrmB [Spinactinospora alkalitolerans]|uniref:S-formylglutathione hydrolase FrmB n=1 Tax=Spinactinospora alkalitolerans TaxID=687207 RepID=A0A852TMG6_9ACTN|nr:alpha/beta hydrolase-fold protein [Spinactinospora alkalitolerans]NYE45128.1 S-formylglutathione hydrolase FrmB [Spinactinospora alkalitolerans]
MFATFSRRTTALVASSLIVATAGMVAVDDEKGVGAAVQAQTRSQGPEPHDEADGAARRAGAPAVLPRPGEVPVCDEPGEDEIITVPDTGAPDGGRPIWIRRPPGADGADVPVLYLLHGSTSTHRTIRDADIGPLLDEQMCRTGVQFVIAAPFGQEVGGSDTEWGDAVDGDFQIETFVTEKAIDAVEGDHGRPRYLRAIGGFSMGGYGAAALSLRHPDTYAQAVSWAGYFKVDDPSGTFGDDPGPHAPDRLLDESGVRDIRFFLVEGKQDHTPLQEGSIHGEAERFAALLDERGMTVETAFPEGDHDFEAWEPTYGRAVDFLVDGWSAPLAAQAG